MWCVGILTEEYRLRMYDLLDLYARPFHAREPVVCLDEKSRQLLKDSRAPLPMGPGMPEKHDYEYVRAGTCNLFVAVEPKGGRRTVQVTDRRAKTDFVAFVRHLLEQVYATANRIHLVLDNLNTHFRMCFEDVLGTMPPCTRGGLMQAGVGGRIGSTRLWAGLGASPFKAAMITLKGSQGWGPVTLFASGMLGTEEPSGTGLDQEYGMSTGMEARIPGLR